VLSTTLFFIGKTSDLSLSSLQKGRRKSFSVNYAYPTGNVTVEFALTYSSQSWR